MANDSSRVRSPAAMSQPEHGGRSKYRKDIARQRRDKQGREGIAETRGKRANTNRSDDLVPHRPGESSQATELRSRRAFPGQSAA